MNYTEQNAATGRHPFPDLVRAFALLGIVLVNVAYFAWPGPDTYTYAGPLTGADAAAVFAVDSLFLMKSYSLFSVMFGAGLAYQMMSAERRGVAFGPRYFRRLLGLLVIGMLHILFAFVGDILVVYAITGAVLFLFRDVSVKALRNWGISLLLVQAVFLLLGAAGIAALEAFDPEAALEAGAEMREEMGGYFEAYSTGSFAEVMAARAQEYLGYIGFILPLQGLAIIAFFLFGLAGVKSGVLQDPGAPLWSRSRRIFLPIGLVGSAAGAWLLLQAQGMLTADYMFGLAIIFIASPFSTLGYLGLIAKWSSGPMTAVKEFFARAGTSSLTAYLLQSLILSLLFSGYGLGLYGKVGAAGCIAIALVTGLATLAFSSLWRTRFARGPVESVLRKWTYLRAGR